MAEALGLVLITEVDRHTASVGDGIGIGVLAALAQQVLERAIGLEVAQQLGLTGRGNDDGIVDLLGVECLLNDILNDRLVEHRQHLFGRALSARQKTRAKTGGGDDCLHVIQGSFRRRRMRPMRAARRPQTKLRYRSILPPKTYVAVRQTQFFSRSTQIIARMVQFYAPAVTGLARRRQRCSACRAMGMRGQNKKDGARNANPVCKEIWRESLIT